MLKCVAMAETGQRKFKNKAGSEQTVNWQACLFEQGPERRRFRLELRNGEAPFAEGAQFVLVPQFGVNDFGDLTLARGFTIQRAPAK